MQTELSTAAMEKDWPTFIQSIYRRLEMGRLQYGDESFDKPLSLLLHEVEQEVIDQAGWSFILWSRLQRLKTQLQAVEHATDRTAAGCR